MNLKDSYEKCTECKRLFTYSEDNGAFIKIDEFDEEYICSSCLERTRINNRINDKNQKRLT